MLVLLSGWILKSADREPIFVPLQNGLGGTLKKFLPTLQDDMLGKTKTIKQSIREIQKIVKKFKIWSKG